MNTNSNEEKSFLNRLTQITEANLSNEQFGVSELVREMGMSRSYVHRHLKALTNQSISHFVCTTRLNKAMEMLRQNEATASEIAYMVGFSSPAYFNHCFHEYFGFPPGEARKYGFAGTEQNSTYKHHEFPEKTPANIIQNQKLKWVNRHRKLVFSSAGIIFLLLFSYIIYDNFIANHYTTNSLASAEKSVIVLPFKNLSLDAGNQYFADGITEDILNHLFRIAELRVVSRTSAEQFRESTLSAREIARQMDVNYVLEGSVRRQNDKVRISVQLIDARRDQHLWSENYDRQLTDIFAIQSDIAQKVAYELQSALSPAEKEQIGKIYTRNPEAYQLYLKGRFFWYRRTKDDLIRSKDYFNEALAIDPNYSLAWTGLADAYFIMAFWRWIPINEGLEKSKKYAGKSLDIDNNVSETHAILGEIANWFDFNWEKAERELKLAIRLNPNYASGHQYYAEYLINIGNFEEAVQQCNIAIELDPNVPAFYSVRAECFYNKGKYSDALNDNKKVIELNRFYGSAYMRNFLIYIRQHEDLKAISELKIILSHYDPAYIERNFLEDIYSKSGIAGIIHWMIDWLLTQDPKDNSSGLFNDELLIAKLYSLLDDWDMVLNSLEKLSLESYYTTRIPYIKYGNDFKPISDDPRFIALIKKMGLEDL